jgi:hypothetical protein
LELGVQAKKTNTLGKKKMANKENIPPVDTNHMETNPTDTSPVATIGPEYDHLLDVPLQRIAHALGEWQENMDLAEMSAEDVRFLFNHHYQKSPFFQLPSAENTIAISWTKIVDQRTALVARCTSLYSHRSMFCWFTMFARIECDG